MKRISKEDQEYIFIQAIESASTYWYFIPDCEAFKSELFLKKNPARPAFSERLWDLVQAGFTIPIHDYYNKSNKLGELSKESIKKGEKLMHEENFRHYSDLILDQWDDITADVWFQYCTLGEVIFS